MYTKIYLRLEPLGLELVASAALAARHDVRLIDLQADPQREFTQELRRFRPAVVGISCNYLANVPEVIEMAQAVKRHDGGAFVFVGGHSASFTAAEILEHSRGAIDLVLCGEGEASVGALLDAVENDRSSLLRVPGAVTMEGTGAPPVFVQSLDDLSPARHLVRRRRRYFIGSLDPAASIEFARGCPWDCTFCSAWTFYGRNYRVVSPEKAVEELGKLAEPGIFIVDDVAFIQAKHGMAIADAIARKGIKKQYYLETRGDVLLRNKEVFQRWAAIGLKYMFLGIEAVDAEGLKAFRKRTDVGKNLEALAFARSLGLQVAINIIADPDWDEARFETIRQFCQEIPEVVNISVNTPYPGTETWLTESRKLTTRDYRLFDIQHAVLPTRLPLERFYQELVATQRVLYHKHLGWKTLGRVAGMATRRLLRGQTNFVRMLFKFDSVYDPRLQMADHRRSVKYQMRLPPEPRSDAPLAINYIHAPKGRQGRALDEPTEHFVDETRLRTPRRNEGLADG
jgi:hopanoid C-3 methylase HpnR